MDSSPDTSTASSVMSIGSACTFAFVLRFFLAMRFSPSGVDATRGADRVVFPKQDGAIYRGQKFCHDDALAHLSIGNLLQVERVQ
jgi:hypothetical protein